MDGHRALLLILVFSTIVLVARSVTHADTAGYWRFEEGSGSTVGDSSGNGNTGTLLDGASHSTDAPAFGVTNTASVELDGIDDTVEVPDDAALDLTGALTLEAFVRLSAMQSTSAGIVVKRNVAANGVSYGLFFSSNNDVRFQVHTETTGTRSTGTSLPLSLDTWHHVAGVSTGTELRLYVDHNLVSTNAFMGALEVSDNPLVIGDFGAMFVGRIDEVRFPTKRARRASFSAGSSATASSPATPRPGRPSRPESRARYGYPSSTTRAALRPGSPVTPPPGCVPGPQRKRPSMGVRWRDQRGIGRRKSIWSRAISRWYGQPPSMP
jgi:hypothetical protein